MKQDENTTTAPIRLDDFEAVLLEGPDALSFAQAQFAADLRTLATGHWCWTAWLDAPGRVLALFLVARTADERLELWAPGARAAEHAAGLKRFVLRSRVKVSTGPPGARGLWGAPAAAGAAPLARGGPLQSLDGTPAAALGGCADRTLILGGGGEATARRDDWTAADVEDALPWIVDGGAGQWIPQALGLDRLQAFSTAKGCYPGQEIVARTHFLGRNRRRLLRGEFDGETPRPGERLLGDDDHPAGEVVIAAQRRFLAVAHEEAPPVRRTEGGAAATAREATPVSGR